MIIQCKQCATKFRFKDELMTGDGVWVRCGRCRHEFFEANTKPDAAVVSAQEETIRKEPEHPVVSGEEGTPKEESTAVQALTPEPADALKPAVSLEAQGPQAEATPDSTGADEEEEEEEKPRRPGFWTPGRIVAYSVLVFLVVSGVYSWLNPGITREVLNTVYPGTADRMLGPAPAAPGVTAGGISFTEVRERFAKSATSGDILVISGLAVNEYEYPVARVKLRGKLLDNAGKVLSEVETFAGNLLNDDELNRLTDKELLAELQKPEGSDMPNTGIRSRASIPFMVVFMNPPKEVDEFIIELSGVERAAAN